MPIENLTGADSTHYELERQHYRNAGTIALPVYAVPTADDPTTPGTNAACRIVRLHSPIETVVISWTAVKEGAPPKVPNPYLFDSNLIFKCGKRSAAAPVLLPGYAGHAWSMAGVYEYHVGTPIDLNNDMATGRHPWEEDSIPISDTIIPKEQFVSTILEGSQGEAWQENEINPVVEED